MRSVPAALSGDWDAAVAAVCALDLEHPPGAQVVYHGFTAATVLAEIVQRATGRSFVDVCREDVLEPLGMSSTTWGRPTGETTNAVVGRDDTIDRDVEIWRTPAALRAVLPGANLHSTARDLCALYLALSGHGPADRPWILAPATVTHATELHAPMVPGLGFGFGYGFMVGTEPGLSLSRGNLGSRRAFGHPGMTFSQAVCEPRDDLVMVFLANVASTQDESDRRFGILCDTVHRAVLAPTTTPGGTA
jgi:CubicO group peptidase (beta-lactamase class C family)